MMLLGLLVPALLAPGALAAGNFRGTGLVNVEEVSELLQQELADKYHHVGKFEDALRSLYTALPKNSYGNLGHETVRYALGRYFMGQYGWLLSGLEAERPSGWVPEHVQRVLEAAAGRRGIDLHGLAMMAATLEDLTEKNAVERLKTAYNTTFGQEVVVDQLTFGKVKDLFETYVIMSLSPSTWRSSDAATLARKKKWFRSHEQDDFKEVMNWCTPILERHFGRELELPSSGTFSLETLSRVAVELDKGFHQYFDRDCKSMKATLLSGQTRRPGRVRLSTFYNMSLHNDWYFTEKEEYLRAIGALDEAEPLSVIIPNYAYARLNCLNETSLYSVCCRNTCDDLLAQLEERVAAPSAPAATLAALAADLSVGSSSLTLPGRGAFDPGLLARLDEVAAVNGGQVPLHGRLFAQWLHHAFPLECPYPHEAGTTSPESPEEWMARTGQTSNSKTEEEIRAHVAADTCAVDWEGKVECGEESLELPWSMTEELLVARSLQEEPHVSTSWLAAALFGAAVLAAWPLARSGLAAGFNFAFVAKSDDLQRRALIAILLLAASAYAADLLDGLVFGVAAVSCLCSLGVKLKGAACLSQQGSLLPTAVKKV